MLTADSYRPSKERSHYLLDQAAKEFNFMHFVSQIDARCYIVSSASALNLERPHSVSVVRPVTQRGYNLTQFYMRSVRYFCPILNIIGNFGRVGAALYRADRQTDVRKLSVVLRTGQKLERIEGRKDEEGRVCGGGER
jgi:hypothetical protein